MWRYCLALWAYFLIWVGLDLSEIGQHWTSAGFFTVAFAVIGLMFYRRDPSGRIARKQAALLARIEEDERAARAEIQRLNDRRPGESLEG